MRTTGESRAAVTLAEMLERERLQLRINRVERVVDVLRAHQRRWEAGGDPPAALGAAARDFGAELEALRGRLRALPGDGARGGAAGFAPRPRPLA